MTGPMMSSVLLIFIIYLTPNNAHLLKCCERSFKVISDDFYNLSQLLTIFLLQTMAPISQQPLSSYLEDLDKWR
jgi:hypothetical protein